MELAMSQFQSDSCLTFECPRCGEAAHDDYETLAADAPQEWRCTACHRVFSVLLVECLGCAAETVSVAMIAAEQPLPAHVPCSACGTRRADHENSDDNLL